MTKADQPLKRYAHNPVLGPDDVPFDCTQVFNAGVCKWRGRYVMVFRADTWSFKQKRETATIIGLATSDDGLNWDVSPKPCFTMGHRTDPNSEIRRAYDPRLTVVDDRLYMCFAVDSRHGIRGGVAVTDDEDLANLEVLSISAPDNRNMVLFPQRVGGRLARLERPMPIYGRGAPEAFDLWYADSPDGRDWGNNQLVLGSEHTPYANNKIGPGAPPVLTDAGWLTTFHAVIKDESVQLKGWETNPWHKRYHAGLLLLDRDEPWRIIGMSPKPVLAPAEPYDYEMDGFRGSVIFPGGMILEDDDTVRIYYGAADTYVALATAPLSDLLATIEPLPGS